MPSEEQSRDSLTERGTEPAAEGLRYATLADYLDVIRRRRRMIVGITVAVTLLALGLSLAQDKSYEATAQVNFVDPLTELNVLPGTEVQQQENPVVRSAKNAELVTRPAVSRRVKKALDTDLSASDLASAVDTQVGVQTNLVSITASTGDPEFAAAIANGYATELAMLEARKTRRELATIERQLRAQIRGIRARAPNEVAEAIQVASVEQSLRQVETASGIARPVEIASRAEVPSAAASPATRRNTVLGVVLGLILGLVAAFVRDSLDRRVRSSAHIHEELGLPILGRVNESAFAFAGLAGNGNLPMPDVDFEAFRVLRMNLASLTGDGRTVPRSLLVTSGGSEEGKSTVSMSLASAAAIAGQRVLLVEADLRRPALARRLGISPAPGLTDYLAGWAAPHEVLQTVELTSPASLDGSDSVPAPASGTMVAIAAGTAVANPAELLVGPRFRDFLGEVTKEYDLVVIDTSPLLAVVDPLEIAPGVDGIIVCARMRRTTRDELRAARSALSTVVDRPMGVVVTGIRRGDPDSYDYYYGYRP